MPGMTLRAFECDLCGEEFTLIVGDLYIPMPRVCDACLKVVWDMDDEALAAHVDERLDDEAKTPASSIIQHIDRDREQWGSLEKSIAHRERSRGTRG